MKKKTVILYTAALIIEICSTFYITAVTEKSAIKMMFWAFVGPFLSLPFIAYQIEAESMKERVYMAFVYGAGYAVGAGVVLLLIEN